MYIAQCNYCPHSLGCEIRLAKLKAVRGAGLTAIRFKCDKLLSELQPGQLVRAESHYSDPVLGTVMRPNGDRVFVWLDGADANGKRCVSLQPDCLEPIDGERVRVCANCGQLEGTESRAGFDCEERDRDCDYRNGAPR